MVFWIDSPSYDTIRHDENVAEEKYKNIVFFAH